LDIVRPTYSRAVIDGYQRSDRTDVHLGEAFGIGLHTVHGVLHGNVVGTRVLQVHAQGVRAVVTENRIERTSDHVTEVGADRSAEGDGEGDFAGVSETVTQLVQRLQVQVEADIVALQLDVRGIQTDSRVVNVKGRINRAQRGNRVRQTGGEGRQREVDAGDRGAIANVNGEAGLVLRTGVGSPVEALNRKGSGRDVTNRTFGRPRAKESVEDTEDLRLTGPTNKVLTLRSDGNKVVLFSLRLVQDARKSGLVARDIEAQNALVGKVSHVVATSKIDDGGVNDFTADDGQLAKLTDVDTVEAEVVRNGLKTLKLLDLINARICAGIDVVETGKEHVTSGGGGSDSEPQNLVENAGCTHDR